VRPFRRKDGSGQRLASVARDPLKRGAAQLAHHGSFEWIARMNPLHDEDFHDNVSGAENEGEGA